MFLRIILSNADVLPPGHGRAAGVDVVGFMPVGSDVLLAFWVKLDALNARTCGDGTYAFIISAEFVPQNTESVPHLRTLR